MAAFNFSDITVSEVFAKEIYNGSTRALMAHSVRAVEVLLWDKFRFKTSVTIVEVNTLTHFGRLSACSVAKNSGDKSVIFIYNDPEYDFSRKRFCIAHELYHILCSAGSANNSGPRRDTNHERLCDHFANDLCRFHDDFYAAPKNISRLRFHGLPYRSI